MHYDERTRNVDTIRNVLAEAVVQHGANSLLQGERGDEVLCIIKEFWPYAIARKLRVNMPRPHKLIGLAYVRAEQQRRAEVAAGVREAE